MRTAGIREARQYLSELLEEVRKGREVVITDRGRPVAKLTAVVAPKAFPDLRRVRRAYRGSDPGLSAAVLEDREDRS